MKMKFVWRISREVTRTNKINTIEVRMKCLLLIIYEIKKLIIWCSRTLCCCCSQYTGWRRNSLAELLVEIASIDFLNAEVALSNCPVLKVLLAMSTTSSMDERNWVVGQMKWGRWEWIWSWVGWSYGRGWNRRIE